jgi:RNA polymerase sigma-70 factor (ECF subfamily)
MALRNELSGPVVADTARGCLVALGRGDEAALRAAYREHQAAVRSFALRLVGHDPEAEDLVHEVFVQLPAAARRFRGEASLATLLMAMVVNHARHHVRAAARRRAATERLARQTQGEIAEPPNPGERRQLAQALLRALDALPLDQRVAFVLCEVEERSSAEAAAIAGTSDGTLRARLLLARRKLRAQLADWRTVAVAATDDDEPTTVQVVARSR